MLHPLSRLALALFILGALAELHHHTGAALPALVAGFLALRRALNGPSRPRR